MKIYRIPQKLKKILFDIDGTLYTNNAWVLEQVDIQVRHYAHISGISEDAAREKIRNFRKKWAAEHGGKKISLGNTFVHLGIPVKTSVEWRSMLLEPSRYLSPDPKLRVELEALKEKYHLICVTNNSIFAAQKTLKAIGVEDLLTDILRLDSCWKSKPDKAILELAVEHGQCSAEECLSIGDRYDIDLDMPLTMGMGGILVDGVEDIYGLHSILDGKS